MRELDWPNYLFPYYYNAFLCILFNLFFLITVDIKLLLIFFFFFSVITGKIIPAQTTCLAIYILV